MDVLNNKSDIELQQSLLSELAKAKNELNCARGDLQKVESRLSFLLVIANILLSRQKD